MKYRIIRKNAEGDELDDQTVITEGDLLDAIEEMVEAEDGTQEGDTIEIRVFD